MPVHLSRAHRRVLGLVGAEDPEAPNLSYAPVHLSTAVLSWLHWQLGIAPGARSGPLFGQWSVEHERIEIVAATTGTSPGQPCEAPFALDEAYLLGATAMLPFMEPALDWLGHWIAVPGSVMPDQAQVLALVQQAGRLNLCSTSLPLVVICADGFDSDIQSYYDSDGDLFMVDTDWPGWQPASPGRKLPGTGDLIRLTTRPVHAVKPDKPKGQ